MIDEMALFAAFPLATRRYIVRALDFGLPRGKPLVRWADSFFDIPMNLARLDLYLAFPAVRERFASGGVERWMSEFTAVQRAADFDLQWPEIASFVPFRFLYERLAGPMLAPWLPSIFGAAATSPKLSEESRAEALATLTMFDTQEIERTTAPTFYPDWDGDE